MTNFYSLYSHFNSRVSFQGRKTHSQKSPTNATISATTSRFNPRLWSILIKSLWPYVTALLVRWSFWMNSARGHSQQARSFSPRDTFNSLCYLDWRYLRSASFPRSKRPPKSSGSLGCLYITSSPLQMAPVCSVASSKIFSTVVRNARRSSPLHISMTFSEKTCLIPLRLLFLFDTCKLCLLRAMAR